MRVSQILVVRGETHAPLAALWRSYKPIRLCPCVHID